MHIIQYAKKTNALELFCLSVHIVCCDRKCAKAGICKWACFIYIHIALQCIQKVGGVNDEGSIGCHSSKGKACSNSDRSANSNDMNINTNLHQTAASDDPELNAPALTGVLCLSPDSVCKPLVSTDQFDQRALVLKR